MEAAQYQVENTLDGQLWIYDRHNGSPVLKFDPKTGDAFIGGQGYRGRVLVQTADDRTTIMLDGKRVRSKRATRARRPFVWTV